MDFEASMIEVYFVHVPRNTVLCSARSNSCRSSRGSLRSPPWSSARPARPWPIVWNLAVCQDPRASCSRQPTARCRVSEARPNVGCTGWTPRRGNGSSPARICPPLDGTVLCSCAPSGGRPTRSARWASRNRNPRPGAAWSSPCTSRCSRATSGSAGSCRPIGSRARWSGVSSPRVPRPGTRRPKAAVPNVCEEEIAARPTVDVAFEPCNVSGSMKTEKWERKKALELLLSLCAPSLLTVYLKFLN